MITRRKIVAQLIICLVAGGVFAFFMAFISPRVLFLGKFNAAQYMNLSITRFSALPELTIVHRSVIGATVFIIIALFIGALTGYFFKRIEMDEFSKPRTKLFIDFIEKMKFVNTIEAFISIIQEELEFKANCEILVIENKTDLVAYNTNTKFISDPNTLKIFSEKFKEKEANLFYFFNDQIEIIDSPKYARGIALITESTMCFVISRFLKDLERQTFDLLINEFIGYERRSATLAKLLDLSELAQEWNMVSDTQKAFLPASIPNVKGVDIGAYFKPLVNVSGDYYDFIEVDENKTLFIVGDISGKGLPAALIMGVVVNTIRISANKEDIAGLIRSVDAAIKNMHLIDKYTVMFIGLVDTQEMNIKYVNASMESPIILTESVDGYKMKTLDSTCSVVGIIDLDDIKVEERPIYRGDLILMSSDGVPETMNEKGVELGETEFYINSIKQLAKNDANEIVQGIADMAFGYAVNRKVRDDLTIVAAKIKG